MNPDVQHVIFNGETRATLDGQNEWAKGWALTRRQRSSTSLSEVGALRTRILEVLSAKLFFYQLHQ